MGRKGNIKQAINRHDGTYWRPALRSPSGKTQKEANTSIKKKQSPTGELAINLSPCDIDAVLDGVGVVYRQDPTEGWDCSRGPGLLRERGGGWWTHRAWSSAWPRTGCSGVRCSPGPQACVSILLHSSSLWGKGSWKLAQKRAASFQQ